MISQISEVIELRVEEWVKLGLQNGEYYLQGGVVRNTTGKKEIVYWLKTGETLVKQQTSGLSLPPIGTLISIFGFGLMQVNFLLVFKKLSKIESKIDILTQQLSVVEDAVREVQRRQIAGALARALAGCQMAHEATRMNDHSSAKHQMVIAKAALLEADTFFSEELKRVDPLKDEFWLLFELIIEIRLSYVRSCVFLDDFAIAKEKLKNLQDAIDLFGLRCLRRDTSSLNLIESKFNRVNLVLSMRDLTDHYISEINAITESKVRIPYHYL